MQLIVKEDKLQRYRDHVLHGLELSPHDKQLYDRYFLAFTHLLDGASERQVVKLLMGLPQPLGGLSQSQAYNVVNGAQEIFGTLDFGNAKKVAKRYIYASRLEEMAARLEELAGQLLDKEAPGPDDDDEDDVPPQKKKGGGMTISFSPPEKEAGVLLEKAANVLMKAAKIRGLMEKDQVENPNRWKAAPNIIFTDDMNALELLREIEDGNYEDVTPDPGATP